MILKIDKNEKYDLPLEEELKQVEFILKELNKKLVKFEKLKNKLIKRIGDKNE